MMSLTWMVSLTHGMHPLVMILPDLTGPCSAVCPWTRSCSTSVKGRGRRHGPSGPAVISSLSTAGHLQPRGPPPLVQVQQYSAEASGGGTDPP